MTINHDLLSSLMPQITFTVIIVAVSIVLARKKVEPINALFQQQAGKRNGKVSSKWCKIVPILQFQIDTISVTVGISLRAKNGPPKTFFIFHPANSQNFHMTLSTENDILKIAKKFGVKDISLGNPEFDDAFFVQSNSEGMAKNILNFKLQQFFLGIRSERPNISLYGKQFVFYVPRAIKIDAELDSFIENGISILKQFNSFLN